jgi:hypothetical protein
MKLNVPVLAALWFASCAPNAVATALPFAERMPGVDLAEGVTELTGVAISPLLGMSAVGAWQYYHAPAALRPRLPWFCRPFVWATGFGLIALCLLKDLLGTAAPPLVKKPLDVVELFENKLSAFVACSAFLPVVVSQLAWHAPSETAFASTPDFYHASILALNGFDIRFVTIPLAIIGFLVVWLACHTINVLIALCPFGIIDGILKLFKGVLLSSVLFCSFISPFLGAAVSLVILFIAALLAPWSFRLTVFGTLFGVDVLFPGRGRRRVRPTQPHAFLARKFAETPVRTYGRLTRHENGAVTFTYRPWLLLPERSLPLPPGNIAIAKGLLFPSLLHSIDPQQRRSTLVVFLPRYRSHEQSIATHFDIVEIRDSPIIKGFRAVRAWFAEVLNLGKLKDAAFRRRRPA